MLIKGLQNLYPNRARWRQTCTNTWRAWDAPQLGVVMSLSDNVASNYRFFCVRTHIHPAFNQKTVTQADMVRLNLLLHRAFTIAFHTCSNKPAYLFREDWCRNLHASLLLEGNGCISVQYCRTKINLALAANLNLSLLYLSGPHKGRRTL